MYELLATPDRWTKGYWARTENGAETSPRDPNAVCWCLSGAVTKCYEDDRISEIWLRLRSKLGKNPVTFNDDPATTHEDVLRVLKELDI